MSRLVGHGRGRRDGGFSFVELLVTIIIAGIAFAAMVPLALQAQATNSSDRMRNLALAVAQERLELIRQLPYAYVVADKAHPGTTPNLYNPSFAGGQFGPTAVVQTGTSSTRTLLVDYTVERVPSTAAPGREHYKQVTVDVYWVGNPRPVKHVVLSTFIYRQYAGPAIVAFEVSNLVHVDEDPLTGIPEHWVISAQPVTLTATIDPDAVAATTKVRFTVTSHSGVEVFRRDVTKTPTAPDAYSDGRFTTVWAPQGYVDGMYTFRAVAYASDTGYQGEPWQVEYALETGPPDSPAGLAAVSLGSGGAKITWNPPVASDIDHYVLLRRASGEADFSLVSDAVPPNMAVTGFIDPSAVVSNTYYYRLAAVDTSGNTGAAAETSVTIVPAADTTKPTAPTGVTGTQVPGALRVTVQWTASTDNVGVAGYRVYRATSATVTWPGAWAYLGDASASASPSFTDTTVQWSTTYYYRVVAYDFSPNYSDPSAVSPAVAVSAAPPPVTWTLTITVDNQNTKQDLFIEVVNTDNNNSYGVEKFRKNKIDTQDWTGLPAGNYRTIVRWDDGTELPSKEQSFSLQSNLKLSLVVP